MLFYYTKAGTPCQVCPPEKSENLRLFFDFNALYCWKLTKCFFAVYFFVSFDFIVVCFSFFQIFVGKGNLLSFVDGFYCCVFSVFLCCTVYNITVCIFNLFPFQDCFSAFCVLDRVQFYFCFVSSLCLVVLIIVDICFCFRCLCLGFFLYFYQIFDRILQMSDRFVYCCLCMRCFQLIFCFCQLCLKSCLLYTSDAADE